MKQLLNVMMFILIISASLTFFITIKTADHIGITLYVGGSGQGNFSSIQSAITAANNGDTIFVYNGIYLENIVIDKSIKLIGEDNKDAIIDGDNAAHVVKIAYNNIIIDSFTIRNGQGYLGIILDGPTICNNTIKNCIIHDNLEGIYLWDKASYNVIENCIIHNNCFYGILIQETQGNIISNCEISENGGGIHLYANKPNGGILRRNRIYNNEDEGLSIGGNPNDGIPFDFDIDISNTINGKPVYYMVNERDLILDETNNIGFIALISCKNITVKNIKISYNNCGILLYETFNSIIEKSTFSNCFKGIWISCSNGNVIRNCSSKKNNEGIFLEYSNSNSLYHNDFKNNYINNFIYDDFSYNYWDDGRSKGNYWDDYKGIDSDKDGIGDTPYMITSINADNYPSMNPFHSSYRDKSLNLPSSRIKIVENFLKQHQLFFKFLQLLNNLY